MIGQSHSGRFESRLGGRELLTGCGHFFGPIGIVERFDLGRCQQLLAGEQIGFGHPCGGFT